MGAATQKDFTSQWNLCKGSTRLSQFNSISGFRQLAVSCVVVTFNKTTLTVQPGDVKIIKMHEYETFSSGSNVCDVLYLILTFFRVKTE